MSANIALLVKNSLKFLFNYKNSFFFQPNTMLRCLSDDKPFQPVMWKVFTRNTDKNNKQFRIEIAKSIPHIGLVTDYGQTC